MKFVSALISGLLMGLCFASSGLSPLAEFQRVLESRRRIFLAFILGASGFIFAFAGLLLGVIEVALQYEAQGFVFWSALMTVATGFLLMSLFCIVLSQVTMPRFIPAQLNFANFQNSQLNLMLMPLLETWLKQNFDSKPKPSASPSPEIAVDLEMPKPPPPSAAYHPAESTLSH